MAEDYDVTPHADNGSTLRPFLLAALLVVSGLTLMGWDERSDSGGARPLIQVSQAR